MELTSYLIFKNCFKEQEYEGTVLTEKNSKRMKIINQKNYFGLKLQIK